MEKLTIDSVGSSSPYILIMAMERETVVFFPRNHAKAREIISEFRYNWKMLVRLDEDGVPKLVEDNPFPEEGRIKEEA